MRFRAGYILCRWSCPMSAPTSRSRRACSSPWTASDDERGQAPPARSARRGRRRGSNVAYRLNLVSKNRGKIWLKTHTHLYETVSP